MSSLQAATPMKPAPPMTNARVKSIDVARDEVDVDAFDLAQALGKLARKHDGPVLAAGAPEREHEVHATLGAVQRKQVAHDALHVVEQAAGRRLLHYVVDNRGVAAGKVL